MALGQSFNIDVETGLRSSPGLGVPEITFGGAANQPGAWNALMGPGLGPFPLLDLAGAANSVVCMRSQGSGAPMRWDSSMTTGDFESLMDDGHLVALGSDVMTNYDFIGLEAGRYLVFTYAWNPGDPGAFTKVFVSGSSTSPQTIGGLMTQMNTFTNGVTHAVDVVDLAPAGVLTVSFRAEVGSGVLNAIQLVHDYRFEITQAGFGAAIVITNSGGVPGNFFVNLVTLNAGSFPYGPVFGIDITVAEALYEVNFGWPFFGILDPNGTSAFVIPPPVPTGLPVYCVGLEVDTVQGPVVSVTPAFEYIVQ
jgi:hypothetical protein